MTDAVDTTGRTAHHPGKGFAGSTTNPLTTSPAQAATASTSAPAPPSTREIQGDKTARHPPVINSQKRTGVKKYACLGLNPVNHRENPKDTRTITTDPSARNLRKRALIASPPPWAYRRRPNR